MLKPFNFYLLCAVNAVGIVRLQVLKFLHSWHKGLLPEVFDNMFQYASNIHGYNTRYAAKHNLYKPNVRTNVGKQLISFMATDIWKDLPTPLKKLIQSVCFSETNYTLFIVRTTNELIFLYADLVTYVNFFYN